jgi:hypothetical protein
MLIKLEWIQTKKQLKDLIPNSQNPRTITKKKMQALEKSLEELGTFKPIVCDHDGMVLGGNQRLTTFLSKLPANYEVAVSTPNRPLTEEEKQKVILQDNGHYGDWQMDLLANNFDYDVIKASDLDLELPSVKEPEIQELDVNDDSIDQGTGAECPKCGYVLSV